MSLYVQEKQVAGEVSLTPGAVITEWLVSLKDSLQAYTVQHVGVEDDRYLSIYQVYAKEGKKEPLFSHPPKLGDSPYTREFIAPLYHPLLLRSPSLQVRICGL